MGKKNLCPPHPKTHVPFCQSNGFNIGLCKHSGVSILSGIFYGCPHAYIDNGMNIICGSKPARYEANHG